MKRIGIYFFCVVAIGCVTSSILFWKNEKSSEIGVEKTLDEDTETQEFEEEPAAQVLDHVINISEENVGYARFLVKEEDGYLVIFDQLTGQRYDETTILVTELPDRIKEQLVEGLFFEDEKNLYEFLENYSS